MQVDYWARMGPIRIFLWLFADGNEGLGWREYVSGDI